MDRSPFPYHRPLQADQVSGRESLVVDVAQRIADRRLTALVGPRRYGKHAQLIYGKHAQLLNLSPGTAQPASEALIGNGMLRRHDGRLIVVDPLLADWLQRRFAL